MKHEPMPRRLLLFALAVTLLASSGCVKPALHRSQSIEEQPKYKLAFIEFDDHGEPWAPSQLERAVHLIEQENRSGKEVAVVLFVHGWHNDASSREERKKDNNVEGFQHLLDEIVETAEKTGRYNENTSLIGVYLAWRGRSANSKIVKPLTFYSRRGAGQRVAGVSTTEAILRVMAATKSNPEAVGIVIGHSFGGMIVERALGQAMVGYTVAPDEIIAPMADLIVLLNPASQSIVAKNMLSVLERNRLRLYRVDAEGNRRESPMVVSVTSTSDSATGGLYPFALGIKGWTKGFREYEATDCSPPATQKSFYKQTAGHNLGLHSHVVVAEPLPAGDRPDDEFSVTESVDPETGDKAFSFYGSENRFTIKRLPFEYNDTPYWIMSVPPELIKSHSDIFTLNTVQLLRTLLEITRPVGSTEQSVIVRETGVRPLSLLPLPAGGVAFVERSRRIYAVAPGKPRPLALSCLPALVRPEAVIGGGHAESTDAYLIINQLAKTGKKGKPDKYETVVIAFDFLVTGYESQVAVGIESDLRFASAAGDAANLKIYLATTEELYVADLTAKRPKAEPLGRFDSDLELDNIHFDDHRGRIFAVDRDDGLLYLIDPQDESPSPVLVAEGLGTPREMDVDSDGRLLVVDAAGGRVLSLDCSDRLDCGPVEIFVEHPGFERPVAVARDTSGTVWVGDLDAQSIFVFEPDGKLRRVIGSLEGGGTR